MSYRIKVVLKIGVTLGLLLFLALEMDLGRFTAVLLSADLRLVLAASALHIASVFLSVVRWRTILENFDIHIAYRPLTRITFIGYFFNIFLPSGIGGDFFRAYYLGKHEKRGMSTTLTTTALERSSGLCALLVIGTFFAFTQWIEVGGVPLPWLFLLISAGYIGANIALFNRRMHHWVIAVLERFHLEQLEEKLELVSRGLQTLRRNRRSIALALSVSFLIQFMGVGISWVAARAVAIDAPFRVFLIFVPLIGLSMLVPLTINGIGLRESLYYLLFSQIGVPVEQAVSLSLIVFVVYVMTAIPGFIIYSFYKKEERFEEMMAPVD